MIFLLINNAPLFTSKHILVVITPHFLKKSTYFLKVIDKFLKIVYNIVCMK